MFTSGRKSSGGIPALILCRMSFRPTAVGGRISEEYFQMVETEDRSPAPLTIRVTRAAQHFDITPEQFEGFAFENGDTIAVLPESEAARLPKSWSDICIEIAPGHAIRVPPKYELFEFKGFHIPEHLIALTGAGSHTFENIGRAHITHFKKFVGLSPDMAILDMGCGVGRDAFQLFDFLSPRGDYIGIDVTRDSIEWCRRNITPCHPNYVFVQFDAFSELYNPFGRQTSMDFTIPVPRGSIDRIVLTSVFTHMLEDEVLHYMREFHRVLKPDGLVYANFFLYSDQILEAARTSARTSWATEFKHQGNGMYGADPNHPRGAVAYSDEAMRRMIDASGLKLKRPYVKGWWSGLYDDPEDGQDAAILGR